MKSIVIQHLVGGYPEKNVLTGFSASMEAGKLTAIIGPNGSGKSTLLKHMIKEKKAKGGNIIIQGKSIESYKSQELSRVIAYTNQTSRLDYAFTVEELVSLGSYASHHAYDKERIEEAIQRTGLTPLKNRLVTTLSGGELQLAMLSRAICQDTPILLFDEPGNNLDPKNQVEMMKLLRGLADEGKCVVAVLHDLDMVLRYADEVLLVQNGAVYAQGKTEAILTEQNLEDVYQCPVKLFTTEGNAFLRFL